MATTRIMAVGMTIAKAMARGMARSMPMVVARDVVMAMYIVVGSFGCDYSYG